MDWELPSCKIGALLDDTSCRPHLCRNSSRWGREASDRQDNWQFPQGGIDKGEDPLHAAFRELAEETSITDVEFVAESAEWLTYDFDARTKAALGARMDKYRGQKQKYFLMKFTGAIPTSVFADMQLRSVTASVVADGFCTELGGVPLSVLPFRCSHSIVSRDRYLGWATTRLLDCGNWISAAAQRLHFQFRTVAFYKQRLIPCCGCLRYVHGDYAGADADIALDVPGHSKEFDAFEWVRIEDVASRVVGFKHDVYAQVAQEFAPIIKRELSANR